MLCRCMTIRAQEHEAPELRQAFVELEPRGAA